MEPLDMSCAEVPLAPKEDMLETILAEHNNLPEKMRKDRLHTAAQFAWRDVCNRLRGWNSTGCLTSRNESNFSGFGLWVFNSGTKKLIETFIDTPVSLAQLLTQKQSELFQVQELEEFQADLASRRNAAEKHIGLLSVMRLA